MPRGKKRLFFGSALLFVAACTSGVIVASRWHSVEAYLSPRWYVGISRGLCELNRSTLPDTRNTGMTYPTFVPRELADVHRDLHWWFSIGQSQFTWPNSTSIDRIWDLGFAVFRVDDATSAQPAGWNLTTCLWPIPVTTLLSGAALVHSARRISQRAKLNLCPSCSYDLKGLDPNIPCPECGRIPPAPGA